MARVVSFVLLRPGGEKQVENATRAANWRNQETMISLIRRQILDDTKSRESLRQDTGDRSQPNPQSWQVSGTQSLPSRKSWHSRSEHPWNS
ncbi:hypothetical protein L3X38_017837 [Prunus dulcis]|uniref:Uncharacterized protein n=1 Tax=Prunus dulcis TaxID=3755 RepID=A0AAD4WAH0_PRUDU|nr:hypothetical protein L3X38_017837 [Prunus dulcis]